MPFYDNLNKYLLSPTSFLPSKNSPMSFKYETVALRIWWTILRNCFKQNCALTFRLKKQTQRKDSELFSGGGGEDFYVSVNEDESISNLLVPFLASSRLWGAIFEPSLDLWVYFWKKKKKTFENVKPIWSK